VADSGESRQRLAASRRQPVTFGRHVVLLSNVQETPMVAVIEGKEEAFGARYIEFRVHRCPTDPDRILGSWRLVHGDSTLVDESRPDAPIAIEFRQVLDCADQYGIPFVWVNDPEELFPPWERP
jgi:hypothetical protein